MALAIATLVQDIRYELGDTPSVDAITSSPTSTGTSVTVADGTLYDTGNVLEFSDGDRMLVRSVSGNTLTVARGFKDGVPSGTGTAHSSGDLFLRDPLIPYDRAIQAIDRTIQGLWPHNWKIISEDITPVSGKRYYDLPTNGAVIMDLSAVVQAIEAGTYDRPFQYGISKDSYPVELVRRVPTAIAGTGVAVYLPHIKDATNVVTVYGRAKLTASTSGSNYSDLSAGTLEDVVVYGAVERLIQDGEVWRSLMEDVSMGDSTVQPGARLRLAAYWHTKYVDKRDAYRMELETTSPRMPRRH